MTRSSRSKTRPKPDPGLQLSFQAIGTTWQITIHDRLDQRQAAHVSRFVAGRIEAFDAAYSRFRPDSLVSRMAERAGAYGLPDDAAPMLRLYRELYEMTDGAMTPLIGQVLHDAGYDREYSLRPGTLRTPPPWDDVLCYDPPVLVLSKPALLDFGAAGKGYLVDLVVELLLDEGLTSFVVDAGGDMVHRGAAALQVGLEHPEQPGQAVGVATLCDGALCGSAGNRRAWAGYHHIIDPARLSSPQHILALWVTADDALLADALTTALYFVSPQELQKRYTFEYAIISDDYGLRASDGFPAEFFLAEDAPGQGKPDG